VSLRTLNNS